ncbi:unnamed protein product [Blepharisma stoltei]|uniref:Uncharacterized protein n=1 Tax=Blepharisma stoltei TaxID=1481888 RepID=A0AAU9JCU8_9CILI|nr:unnamed protein product [Blepharisma stoltei]
MNKSKSEKTLPFKNEIIKQIESSFNLKFQELAIKRKNVQNLEFKQQKHKLQMEMNTEIQNEINSQKKIGLEKKIEKTMKLKTERRREILREIAQKNHKFSASVQARKIILQNEEKQKVEEYFKWKKSIQDNPQISQASREDPSKLSKKNFHNESLFTKRESITAETINKMKEKTAKHEENRLTHLTELLDKPGCTRWLKSASGGRIKSVLKSFPASVCNTTRNLPTWDCINGYTGPALTTRTDFSHKNEDYKINEDLVKSYCHKLNPNSSVLTIDQAMLYLQLRGNGCPKEEAISFSSRQRCRIDSTQRYDGPVGYKILKRIDNRKQGPNWNGWQVHQAEYHSEFKYKPYKNYDTFEDYSVFADGYEKFTRKYDIVDGVLVKKDQFNEKDFDLSLSPPRIKKKEISDLEKSLHEEIENKIDEKEVPEIIEIKATNVSQEQPKIDKIIRHTQKSYTQLLPRFSVQQLSEKKPEIEKKVESKPPEDKIDLVEEKGTTKIVVRSVKPVINPTQSTSFASSEFRSPRGSYSRDFRIMVNKSKTTFPPKNEEQPQKPLIDLLRSNFELWENQTEFMDQKIKNENEATSSNSDIKNFEEKSKSIIAENSRSDIAKESPLLSKIKGKNQKNLEAPLQKFKFTDKGEEINKQDKKFKNNNKSHAEKEHKPKKRKFI